MSAPLFVYLYFSDLLHLLVVDVGDVVVGVVALLAGITAGVTGRAVAIAAAHVVGVEAALGLAFASPVYCSHTLCALFVLIMSIGRNDIYMHLGVEDFINEAVLLCDTAAPLSCTVAR